MSTLCRRIDATSGRLIDGSVVFSSPAHEEKRRKTQKLLHFLNSDWGSSRLRHHCVPGQCDRADEADACAKMLPC